MRAKKWMYTCSFVGIIDAVYLWLVEKVGVRILPTIFQQWYVNAHPAGSSSFTLPYVGIEVSFALLGVVGYVLILAALALENSVVNLVVKILEEYVFKYLLKEDEPGMLWLLAEAAICSIGLGVSLFLAHRAIFEIGVVCPLCLLTWCCMVILTTLSWRRLLRKA